MKTNLRRLIQTASITGVAVCMLAATTSAAVVTFNTSAPGTGFGIGGIDGLTLNSSSGAAATLLFTTNIGNTSGIQTNVNLGNFVLACATCSIQSGGVYARFAPFAFDIVVTDLTAGGATGTFTGTSIGGDVYHGVSPISIDWSPLQLGPGTSNATNGDFGPTIYVTTNPTWIVAPNSGDTPGQTTVQAYVDSAVPEPATLGLVGAALIGLGAFGRKRLSRQ